MRHAVLAAIGAAGHDQWTEAALESLFLPPIELDQSSHPWTYINGQHRAQAMRDQRVLRTVHSPLT